MNGFRVTVIACGLLGLGSAATSAASTVGECFLDTVVNPEPEIIQFGGSAALHGDALVVGVFSDDELGNNAGAAYVFQRQGIRWIQQTKLFASDAAENEWFGANVALADGSLAVGAIFHHEVFQPLEAGAVYIFRREATGWIEETKLVSGTNTHFLGSRVSIRGNIVAALSTPSAGAKVHIFQKHPNFGWIFETSVTGSNASNIVITATRIVSGEYIYRNAGTDVNGKIIWQLESVLAPSVPTPGFGYNVAATEDMVVVGAPLDNVVGPNAGSAYVFRRNVSSWVEEAKLYPLDWTAFQTFGVAVATDGQLIVVGQSQDNGGPGSVYFFRQVGGVWVQQQKMLPPNPQLAEDFGTKVLLNGAVLAVSDPGADDAGTNAGAVYVIGLAGVDCNENGTADSCDILEGRSRDIDGNALPDECVPPIPSVSGLGLIGLFAGLLIAGITIMRRLTLTRPRSPT